ncbi:MAG: hypothetical protein OJJ21_16475 [Ferrovibrio sp.]|uniref:hypothetical protein n=1 Tax=Ferrovibrio sp. TaxID=1917215 RepID=UPI0026103543|nr:hypothetical protein [Ferrovibrio sp.]MCW0235198.1 hypothetical protein [Ferrovibrio sp.]
MRKLKIDQPEIVKVQRLMRPSMLSRYVCLSPLDWKLFATALEDAFPDAIYSRKLTIEEEIGAERPEPRLERKLCRPDPDGPAGIAAKGPNQMHFGPATELVVEKDGRWLITVDGLFWPKMFVGRPGEPTPADAHGPERRREGQIQIHLAPHHKGHARFARQIYRLLAQFTTNERQVLVGYPHYDVLPQPPRPLFGLWIGHDALRWAREDPKRLLAYEWSPMSTRTPDNLGYGYRPKD